MSLLAKLVDRVEEGGAEVGKCDHYRSQLEGVRASLGDSARQGTVAEALARLVTVVRRCRDMLRSSLVRVAWPSLDSSLAGLNTLFKTLQSLSFSYRFGLTSCSDLNSYTELFTHSDTTISDWGSIEKYFHRCFARFRQLQPLLDR